MSKFRVVSHFCLLSFLLCLLVFSFSPSLLLVLVYSELVSALDFALIQASYFELWHQSRNSLVAVLDGVLIVVNSGRQEKCLMLCTSVDKSSSHAVSDQIVAK